MVLQQHQQSLLMRLKNHCPALYCLAFYYLLPGPGPSPSSALLPALIVGSCRPRLVAAPVKLGFRLSALAGTAKGGSNRGAGTTERPTTSPTG